MTLIVSGWVLTTIPLVHAQTPDPVIKECTQAGLIFGMNPVVNKFLLKGPTGHIIQVNFNVATVFTRIGTDAESRPVGIPAQEVEIGDLVCVNIQGPAEVASRVSVVRRAEVAKRQHDFLATWQQSSLYGAIRRLDLENGRIVIAPADAATGEAEVTITLGPNVQYRSLASTATSISDIAPSRVESLQIGDRAYVRGVRAKGSNVLAAGMVVKGEFRTIVGTIIRISGLGPAVKLQEFGAEKVVEVRFHAPHFYRAAPKITTPAELVAPSGLPLVSVGLSDITVGDAVLAIVKQDAQPAGALGLLLITSFGTFGMAPDDPSGKVAWLLK
jgi:hypothetical protein